VLTGKDLDALSDDPDELSNELTGWQVQRWASGGQIFIDGFTGPTAAKSRSAPSSSTRIPSAQYDTPGYGRWRY